MVSDEEGYRSWNRVDRHWCSALDLAIEVQRLTVAGEDAHPDGSLVAVRRGKSWKSEKFLSSIGVNSYEKKKEKAQI